MKDILIIAQFSFTPGVAENSRFSTIIEKLVAAKNRVELITTSFQHAKKEQRAYTEEGVNKLGYRYTTLYEPGYQKNISPKRLYSHYIFGRNLKKYLADRKVPDVIYCAVPSLDAGYAAYEYAKKNRVRFIIDVQDLWPEAFEMVFRVPVASSMIFAPIRKKADKIYAFADEIVGVSDTYCKRAGSVNQKSAKEHSVFLGTSLKKFDEGAKKHIVKMDAQKIRLAYCGTLGHSYDLRCVMDALELLKEKGVKNIQFVIMGDGPLKKEFKVYAKERKIDAKFTGRLAYDKMCALLCACDIAVNPIVHGAAQSIINKHADYAMAGIPVISTQENEEYRNLVDEYQMGFNCKNNDAVDLSEKMLLLIQNEQLRTEMGRNARRCAEKRFDRDRSYQEIVDIILSSGDSNTPQ